MAAFTEVFARLEAVEAQLIFERQARAAAEAQVAALSRRVAGLEGEFRGG